MTEIKIGILALQGGFKEHFEIIDLINKFNSKQQELLEYKYICKEIKSIEDLKLFNPDGIILPGGESTTMSIIASGNGIFEHLKDHVKLNKPVYGTCAGAIMLSDKVESQKEGGQSLIGGLRISTQRNYFGRQINSFHASLSIKFPSLGPDNSDESVINDIEGIFIRAPGITGVHDESVQVLGHYNINNENIITAVKQGNILASVFHPELTTDIRFHKYFLKMVVNHKVSNEKGK